MVGRQNIFKTLQSKIYIDIRKIFFIIEYILNNKHLNDLNDFLALFLIYCPLAVAGYYCYGDAAESSIVNTMSHGPLRITAEVCFLIHLIAAFPIVFNPGAQYFEELMNIPSSKYFSYILI